MVNKDASVSVVLPTYNGSKFLRRAIESVLSQTHRNLELILVDDGSTDETPNIARSYEDKRLHYIRNAKNQRLPRSLNIGFKHSTGEYLTWTSDDNEYLPQAIEKMLACLRSEPEIDFVYADYWAFEEGTGREWLVRFPDIPDLGAKDDVGACFLYRRRVYETIGDYNANYEMVEDYDYWMRVHKKFKMKHLAESLYRYQYHPDSLTATHHFEQDLLDVILKYRNGYLPFSKLGWTAVYYFENVRCLAKSAEEKRKRVRRTLANILRLSPLFFLEFSVSVACFWLIKNLRDLRKGQQ